MDCEEWRGAKAFWVNICRYRLHLAFAQRPVAARVRDRPVSCGLGGQVLGRTRLSERSMMASTRTERAGGK